MSYFLTVFNGRVMGLRENLLAEDRRMVERLAEVLGVGAEVYEVPGDMPRDYGAAIEAFQWQLDQRAIELAPCYLARAAGCEEDAIELGERSSSSGVFARLRLVRDPDDPA